MRARLRGNGRSCAGLDHSRGGRQCTNGSNGPVEPTPELNGILYELARSGEKYVNCNFCLPPELVHSSALALNAAGCRRVARPWLTPSHTWPTNPPHSLPSQMGANTSPVSPANHTLGRPVRDASAAGELRPHPHRQSRQPAKLLTLQGTGESSLFSLVQVNPFVRELDSSSEPWLLSTRAPTSGQPVRDESHIISYFETQTYSNLRAQQEIRSQVKHHTRGSAGGR